eukprot:TRINITY_DN2012_c0_g1_i2.p1 TRINITY_DN2012_c0_g1~~TRINITY_DN2012_c0_g1_i2.p1  ORF type:complete len:472 (-),score=85.44 TRINITY_DN2012_c0_g1_i2:190-1605(-)
MRLDQDTMSHTSDDAPVLPGSESFWEPGNYKRTTKRIEDGEKLCKDLIALVQERANIEKEYAKMLKNWSNKWNKHIENGPEYGTTEAAWKGVCSEADKSCELHLRVKDNLLNEVVNSIKNWQKDNYHRAMMQLKEKKELEEQFRKAQKPWAKLLDKVNKAKSDYHTACKNERTAINQEKNANSDSSLSQDQVRKLQDKVSKCATSVKKTKEEYELALLDINNYNSRYMEDMTDVFERCQRKEAQRLQTFKETLFSIHKCLNVSQDPQLPSIYDEFYHTVNNADHEKDLRWWSNTHGVNMAMAWPQFEEYNSVKGGAKKATANGATKSTTVEQSGAVENRKSHESAENLEAINPSTSSHFSSIKENDNLSKNPFEDYISSSDSDNNGVKEQNPFDEDSEEWDDAVGVPLEDTGEPGVPVKALYDYEAAEDDELSFKTGDEFEKLEDEDEQGWCKGRKDGRVGLYPANYVEPL